MGEGPQIGLLLGHQVRPAHVRHLNAVLVQAKPTIGRRHLLGVMAGNVLPGLQRRDGRDCVPHSEGGIDTSMDELQELDGEFDVPQPAPAKFYFPRRVV